MANNAKKNVAPITEEDIDALQEVLNQLKESAQQAHANKNLTVFRIYQKLIKVVSPEIVKANARKEREDLARLNKEGEALKSGTGANP